MSSHGTLWSYPYASATPTGAGLFGSVRVAEIGGYGGKPASVTNTSEIGWCTRILSVHADGNPVAAAEMALRSRPAPILSAAPNGVPMDRTRLLSAILGRRPPTAEELADFVAFRTGRMADAGVLHEVWSTVNGHPSPAEGPRERRLRRRLKRVGGFTPGDWRRVAWLSRADRSPNRSVAFLAAQAGTDLRSLRSWSRHLLGVTARGWKSLLGWEWMLEAGLRRSGVLRGLGDGSDMIPSGLKADSRSA